MNQPNNVYGRISAGDEARVHIADLKGKRAGLSVGRRRGRRFATGLMAGLLFLSSGGVVFFRQQDTANAQTSERAPQKGPKVQPVEKELRPTLPQLVEPTGTRPVGELFLEHANKAGVVACAATYGELGRIVTAGATFSVQTQAAGTDAPSHGIQGLIGMNYSNPTDYTGPASGVVLAVPTDDGCEGNMVRIVPFPQSCTAAQALLPHGSTPLDPLSGLPVFGLPTGGQVMFVPAASGCVVVSVARLGG